MKDLGTLGNDTEASAINNKGQVVGSTKIASGSAQVHAFLWENGKMTDLGTLGGLASFAVDINEQGQIVGWSETASNEVHATLWTIGTQQTNNTKPSDPFQDFISKMWHKLMGLFS